MDLYEATNVVLSKIKTLDPENASRIMGCILLQGLSDADLLRIAFGPDTLLQNLIITAKTQLGLLPNGLSSSSSSSTPSSPSPLNPMSRPINCNNPFSQSSPRDSGGGSFADFGQNQSPPARVVSGLLNISPKASPFLSYDNIRAGSALMPSFSGNGGGGSDSSNANGDFFDECRLDEYLSFLDDSSSSKEEFSDLSYQFCGNSGDNGDTLLHRRRFSESDASFGTEDESFGLGYRPCMYFAKGYCKNGDNCKFVHSGFDGDSVVEVNVGGGGCGAARGSPREMEGFFLQQQQEEMMRMKAVQLKQQLAYNKYMHFLLQRRNDPQRYGAVAIMGDEFQKFGQFRPERNDLLAMGNAEKANSVARQIYLTFPADSTFKDEDVSNYFSTFGPVQDVRIPYQQKRMFGFVTFVHPETVKIILARGNPHFICDSRVLVKPYKEKGKVANDRRQLHVQQQQLERGNFSPVSSPSCLDPRELYDVHLGPRLLYSNQEMMLRRKLEEQAELQQAIELQGRRLINLQLPDIRGDYIHHHQRSLSVGAPISLPTHNAVKQNVFLTSDGNNQEVQGNCDNSASAYPSAFTVAEKSLHQEVNIPCSQKNNIVNGIEKGFISETRGVHDCSKSNVEHALPDNLFATPTKSSENQQPAFSSDLAEVRETTESSIISSSEKESSVPITSTVNGPS